MGDRLRPLWEFDDLDASERRFEDQLTRETSGAGRAEVLTQLARVQGLRGRFAEGDRLIDQAQALSDGSAAVEARIQMERGRLRNSSGDAGEYEAALEAFQRALASRERYPEMPALIQHAKEAVAEALRALGREEEASRL